MTEASRGAEVLVACEAALPDCMLLDYRLPDMDGLEALAALRARSDVPVVMLTSVGSETVAVEALRRGAQDYLVKGTLTPERLSLTIQHAVSTVRLTRQRDQMQTLLSMVLEALPVGGAVLDPDLCIRHANPALTDFLGQTRAALPGQVVSQLWPGLMDDLAAPCAQVQLGERFSDLELCLLEPSGADGRWLSVWWHTPPHRRWGREPGAAHRSGHHRAPTGRGRPACERGSLPGDHRERHRGGHPAWC
ncbi:MAG: response regulator [Chloroflexales bacterium]|nr:response regulator [Chloroflexales bacterium]